MTTRTIKDIAEEVLRCARSHVPESRLIGNVRADELADLASCAANIRAVNVQVITENERLLAVPEQLITMVEARAKWAQEVAKRNQNSPWQDAHEAVADALEATAKTMRAFMAAKEGEG